MDSDAAAIGKPMAVDPAGMSRSGYKAKRKKKKGPNFVMVRKDLLKDPEWRKLRSSSKVVYIYLRNQFNHETIGELSLAYSRISDFMSSSTINEAFKELQKAGFIEKINRGGLYGGTTTYKCIGKYGPFIYQGFEV